MDVTSTNTEAAVAPVQPADAGGEVMTRAEVQKIIADRDRIKAALKEIQPLADAGKKALDATKTAEERLLAVTGERDQYKTQAERATAAMTSRLAAEIDGIPEAMRGIIPEGLDPADRLEWIGKARAAGIFGVKSASPGAELHGGTGGATVTERDFVNAPEAKRKAMRQQVADGKLTVVPG